VVYQKVIKRTDNKFVSNNIDFFSTDIPSGWCSGNSGEYFVYLFFSACHRKYTLYCGAKCISIYDAICVIQAVRFTSPMLKHYKVS